MTSAFFRTIDVTPLSDALGAQIDAGPLKDITDEQFAEIRLAWVRYHVVRFRGQMLSDEIFDAFARRLGPPQPTSMTPNLATRSDLNLSRKPTVAQAKRNPQFPHIAVVSNIIENGVALGGLGDGELMWHSDQSSFERPPSATLLYALEAPHDQARTGFLNTHLAYEMLSWDLKERVASLQLKHDESLDAAGYRRPETPEHIDPRTSPGWIHPLVCTHPESKRNGLFLGRRPFAYLVGLSMEESDALLDALWRHATQGAFVWRQQWRPGDLIIWDNRSVLHQREAFGDPTARRLLHRIMVQGHKPVLERLAA